MIFLYKRERQRDTVWYYKSGLIHSNRTAVRFLLELMDIENVEITCVTLYDNSRLLNEKGDSCDIPCEEWNEDILKKIETMSIDNIAIDLMYQDMPVTISIDLKTMTIGIITKRENHFTREKIEDIFKTRRS